jgi:hypothetical protein
MTGKSKVIIINTVAENSNTEAYKMKVITYLYLIKEYDTI